MMQHRVLFPVLMLLLLILPAAGQSPAPTEPFTDQIEVSVVNLDVFVSDKNGQPIEGLEAKDFEILEDGRPVKITNFYHESQAAAPAATRAGETAEDHPVDRRLRLVVFIDDVNTGPARAGPRSSRR